MHDTPRYEAYEKSDFFGDARSMRPQVADTVARGQLREDPVMFAGKQGTGFVSRMPIALTPQVMHRGRERFDIYCAPCHGAAGRGDGVVVRRGYRVPPSFHIDRLRGQADGYFFDVITNGFGVMPDYAAQVAPADRWAIVAYVRALQLSQNATVADVPAARRGELSGAAPVPGEPDHSETHKP
jgi:mono/diheme cytochrome c family protein